MLLYVLNHPQHDTGIKAVSNELHNKEFQNCVTEVVSTNTGLLHEILHTLFTKYSANKTMKPHTGRLTTCAVRVIDNSVIHAGITVR